MLSLWRLAIVLVAAVWYVHAQATTSALCTTDPWTSNQESDSPCLVASALEGACNAGKWNIPPLTAGSQYSGPLEGESNVCECSTVVFSLVAACGACQGGSVATWAAWKTNCSASDISVASFPITIPSGITVPSWAYLDVTQEGIWDPTAALNAHNSGAPDSSAGSPIATSSSGKSASTGGASTASPSATSSSSSTSSSSHSSTNAGAIAGGVVGGVVGVALLALGAFWFARRRRNQAREARGAPSAQFIGNGGGRGEKVDLVGGMTSPAPAYGGFNSPGLPMQEEPPRLYDPSDPSTFPTTPAPSLPGYTTSTSPVPSAPYSQAGSGFSGPYGHAASGQGYSGVPEV